MPLGSYKRAAPAVTSEMLPPLQVRARPRRPITKHGFKQSQASAKKLKPSSAAMAAKYRATASRFGCCTTDTKWIERSNWLRAVHGVTLLHSIDPSCQTLWTWPLLHGHNSCSRRPITTHGFKQTQASAKKLKPSSAAMAAKYRAKECRTMRDTKWIELSICLRDDSKRMTLVLAEQVALQHKDHLVPRRRQRSFAEHVEP